MKYQVTQEYIKCLVCVSPPSEAEKYLPQEMMSTAFTFSREGIREETPLHRMKR